MNHSTPDEISFKAAYSRGQSVIVPVNMILPGSVILLVVWTPFVLLRAIGFPQNYVFYFLLSVILFASYIVVFYGKPWKKFGKLHRPPKVIVANELVYEKPIDRIKPIIRTRTRKKTNGVKEVVHAIEDKIHLAELLRFRLDDHDFGAYLQEDSQGLLTVVWMFECLGISYSLTQQQYNQIAKRLEAGLADFSRTGSAETITFDAEVRSSCAEQIEAADAMASARQLPPEDLFILEGIKERTYDLTRDGKHARRTLRIYATTNLSDLNLLTDSPDISEQMIQWLENKVPGLKPVEDIKNELRDRLILAYERGFKRWKRLIEDKLGLSCTPANCQSAWQWAWDEVNDGIAPPPNSLLTVSKDGLEVKRSDTDRRMLASLLFQAGEPFLDKSYVYLQGRQEYIGMCVMAAFPNRLWPMNDRRSQLLYGSSAINDEKALNTRVLVQFSTVPPAQAAFARSWATKTENSMRLYNAKRDKRDVPSEVMMEEAVEAERALKKGGTTIRCAWVAMVYRQSIAEMNDAMSSLVEHSSFSGRVVVREVGYCDQLWLSALPALTSHKLLQRVKKPETLFSSFERRLENEADGMVSLLPIMKELPIHSKGLQMVSRLRSPMCLDPVKKRPHGNIAIFGEKGSGKSKLVQGLGKNAKMQGARIIIIDGARSDGSGSFDEWAKFEPNSAYFNPTRDSSNIFDGFDDRYIVPFDPSNPESIDRWGMFEAFLIQALSDLSYQGTNPEVRSQYKKLHATFVGAFFRDPEIKNLRAIAFDGGIGTQGWEEMPTLNHYLKFLSVDNLLEEVRGYVDLEILSKTKGTLYALLQQPLGKAISRPTNVNFEKADLIVYAMSAIVSEDDMLPLSIAMNGNIIVQTNKPGLKVLILEEAAINLKYRTNALIAAQSWAQGRKSDLHCILVSQTIEPVLASIAADDILKNTPVTVVGAIVSDAIKGLSESRLIPEDLLAQCTQADFYPKDEVFGRNFLVSEKGNHSFVTDYPDFRSMFLTMNEAKELQLKAKYKNLYPDNKFIRIQEGAKELRDTSIHVKRKR